MRKLLALLLTVALVLSLSGAAMAESTGSTPANTLYISGAPETLFDAMWENFGGLYKNNVFRALFLSNADFTDVEPDLAESVTVSDDNLQFDITLRTDAVWHDASPSLRTTWCSASRLLCAPVSSTPSLPARSATLRVPWPMLRARPKS